MDGLRILWLSFVFEILIYGKKEKINKICIFDLVYLCLCLWVLNFMATNVCMHVNVTGLGSNKEGK